MPNFWSLFILPNNFINVPLGTNASGLAVLQYM